MRRGPNRECLRGSLQFLRNDRGTFDVDSNDLVGLDYISCNLVMASRVVVMIAGKKPFGLLQDRLNHPSGVGEVDISIKKILPTCRRMCSFSIIYVN